MQSKDIINNYHIRDTRRIEGLLLDKECIDVTITSPPYWNLKDYGFKRQIGFGQSYEKYLSDIQKIFDKIYKHTKITGSLWIISDTFKRNGELRLLPFDISARLSSTGWILQDIIIWQKDKTLPWSHQGKLRNIFEYIAFYSKSKNFKYHVSQVRDINDIKEYWVRYPERYCPEGKAPSRNWYFSIPQQGSWGGKNNYVQHACPLPPRLIERILHLTSDKGDLVLDPFAGSGTVLATAHAMGRRYIGIDRSTKDKKMFSSSVLPSVVSEYQSRNGEFKKRDKAGKNFSKLIKSLRRLKFPKEIIRIYGYNWNKIRCCGVLTFNTNSNKTLCIFFIFQRKKDIPTTFIKRVNTICSEPPLSKYGVQSKILALDVNSLDSKQFLKKGLKYSRVLWKYEEGRFYSWSKQVRVEELCEMLRTKKSTEWQHDRYPPIYSTIKIKIDPNQPKKTLEACYGKDQKEKKEEEKKN